MTAATWDAPVVPIDEGDHLLLYTDGVWEILADDDGRAEERFLTAIARAPDGGASLLDTILGDVHDEMAGQVQPDDLTLLTATVVGDAPSLTRSTGTTAPPAAAPGSSC